MKKILTMLLISAALFSSCKKNDAPAPEPILTVDANGNITPPSDAEGALYSIYTKSFVNNTGSNFDGSQFSFAWFGAPAALKDAGVVKSNTYPLDNIFNQYFSMDPSVTFFDPATGIVNWSVEGNASSGITGFSHTDNTTFPTGALFSLPATININASYTITNSATGDVAGVVYSALGNKGQINKVVMGSNSTGVTFTAAELGSAADANDLIDFSIMPVKYTSAICNGKKYYFVKQYQQIRETATQ